jgi:hypothetical protein
MASLLTIIQDVADRIGLVRPSSVVGSSDHQVRQLFALANQEGREQARRHPWQSITFEKTFTTVAQESQTNAIPADFDRFVPETMFNRSRTRQLVGPMTPQEWADYKGSASTVVFDAFRVRGSALLYAPTPNAGETVAYEYVSKFWCAGSEDTAPDQSTWVSDNDETFLDVEATTQGIVWRFQRSRGLDYSESFQQYELQLATLMGRDGGSRVLSMGERRRFKRGTVTGIFGVTPEGSLLDDDGAVLTD